MQNYSSKLKKKEDVICKTGLKKNVIDKEVFDREILLCQQLSKENKGCNWGECEKCGVLLLLYKLHKGKLVENKTEIKNLKNKFLKLK